MIPYLGCKQRFAKEFLAVIPQAEHFYDLFGGGGSVTEAACEVSQSFSGLFGKWQKWHYFHYNELNRAVCDLNKAIWNGTFDFEFAKKQIPTKERYYKERTLSILWGAFVSFVWSWGNRNGSFIYPEKSNAAERDEHILRIKRMEKSPLLLMDSNLQMTNLDYRDVKIKPNSVVYCDIPYDCSRKDNYGRGFNIQEFYEWAKSRDFPVYFSEYSLPEEENFTSVWEKLVPVKINKIKNAKAIYKTEKLFWNGVTL